MQIANVPEVPAAKQAVAHITHPVVDLGPVNPEVHLQMAVEVVQVQMHRKNPE